MQLSDDVRSDRGSALETRLGAAPLLRLYSGAAPANTAAAASGTLLAQLTLPADAFNLSADGALSMNGNWSGAGAADGTAGHYRFYEATGRPATRKDSCRRPEAGRTDCRERCHCNRPADRNHVVLDPRSQRLIRALENPPRTMGPSVRAFVGPQRRGRSERTACFLRNGGMRCVHCLRRRRCRCARHRCSVPRGVGIKRRCGPHCPRQRLCGAATQHRNRCLGRPALRLSDDFETGSTDLAVRGWSIFHPALIATSEVESGRSRHTPGPGTRSGRFGSTDSTAT